MVELSPVDQVSVDMSPSNDVSTYGTMIRKHNSPYQIPTPDERAMIAGRDARADSVSPNVAITRTREWEEEGVCSKLCVLGSGCIVASFIIIGTILYLILHAGA
ncbi:hypothetical protein Pst134EB_005834 [Puccinia striiformis f. sp. tritici]|nr:hypothetical protein Pst134EB_005834 [Puccinia striiformis f. sp. tritici]